MAGVLEAVIAFPFAADGIDFGIGGRKYFVAGIGEIHKMIAAEIAVFEDVMNERMAVVAGKPIAPVVGISAELAPAGFKLHRAGIGADAQIFSAQFQLAFAFP